MTESAQLAQCIDTIERGYEYLLAYAAQGRQDEGGTEARSTLESMQGAAGQVAALARAALAEAVSGDVGAYLDAVARDALTARGAMALVLGRARIGSLLVDNLNASVHLRALLTDVFLLEQALKVEAG